LEAAARQAAPGELELVRQFVNTHDVEEGIDEISTPDGLARWLSDNGFDSSGSKPDGEQVARATEMREALRSLLLANLGEPLDERAVRKLNEIAARAQLLVRFDRAGGTALEPTARGADAALGAILAIVFQSMAEGTWERLKVCREDTCQWAFYDRSKNRSGAWCSMAVCGNRAKARAYRERHSGTSTPK
jgi:predicted RNA-binding Zn ribbon-like protein